MPSNALRAALLDSGDTLIDEGTEVKNGLGEVQRAALLPGASELVHKLKRRGYPLMLVADGPVASFVNGLGQHGLYTLFDAHAISGVVGVEKPDARMFLTALDQLGIPEQDYGHVVMVGNNLERDIAGANALGLVSVWLDWAPRRSKVPQTAIEVPDYAIREPLELLVLLDRLERQLASGRPLRALPPDPAMVRAFSKQIVGIETVCHKGANACAPENTLAAAQLCVDWRMDWVEIDVNMTRDGVLYLLHGPTVDQTTDGHGYIADLTAAQVDRLDAGSWFGPEYAGEPVPRLEPFLQWIKGRARVYLDVKRADLQQLVALVRRLDLVDQTFFWFGEDDLARRLQQLAPEMALKVNVSNEAELHQAKAQFGARLVEIEPPQMSKPLREACHRLGVAVMVREEHADPASYRRILAWQADLINLDHGDLFARVATAARQQNGDAFDASPFFIVSTIGGLGQSLGLDL
jgi:glycerophosphoryl diester phosphodiesterase